MKTVTVISNGIAEAYTSLEAGAERAAKIVQVLGPTTIRIRIRADRLEELFATLDKKLF
jgi:hypothetical protein